MRIAVALILLASSFAHADPLDVNLGSPNPSPIFLEFSTTLPILISPSMVSVPTTNLSATFRGLGALRPFALVGHTCPGTMAEVNDAGATIVEWTGLGDLSGTNQISCEIEVRPLQLSTFPLQLQLDCDQCGVPTDNRATVELTMTLPPDVAGNIVTNIYPAIGPGNLTLDIRNIGPGAARNVSVALFGNAAIFTNIANNGVGKCLSGYVATFDSIALAINQLDPGERLICPFSFVIPSAGEYNLNLSIIAESTVGRLDPYPDNNNDMATLRTADLTVNTRFSFNPDANPGDGICADNNTGACSIRAAVEESNALPGYQRITIPYEFSGYFLGGLTSYLVITDPVLISGVPDPVSGDYPWITRVDGDNAGLFRIFTRSTTDTVLEQLDLRGQTGTLISADGAVIQQADGDLWLRQLKISGGRTSGQGGGIRGTEGLRLSGVEFVDNQAAVGGGLAMFGVPNTRADLFVEGAHFFNNRAVDDNGNGGIGGAFYAINAEAEVRESSFVNNSAVGNMQGQGGAIFSTTLNELLILNSTISGNQAGHRGGGIYHSQGLVALEFVTLVYNEAGPGDLNFGEGGGIYVAQLETDVGNSIIAYNSAQAVGSPLAVPKGGNCFGALDSRGYNSISAVTNDSDCSVLGATGTDSLNASPGLADLEVNDEGSRFHRLTRVNDEIDGARPNCGSSEFGTVFRDQLRLARPREGDGVGSAECDRGAFEASAARIDVAVSTAGPANWEITASAPYSNCTQSPCRYDFVPVGSTVTLTPVAGAGTSFLGWNGDCSGTGNCVLEVSQSRSVSAEFASTADDIFADSYE